MLDLCFGCIGNTKKGGVLTVISGFDLGIVIAAFVATLGAGIWASTKIKTTEDYFLARRSLGLIVLVSALAATEIHPGTVIDLGSRGYELGLYGSGGR